MSLDAYIAGLPEAGLHLHIEGSFLNDADKAARIAGIETYAPANA